MFHPGIGLLILMARADSEEKPAGVEAESRHEKAVNFGTSLSFLRDYEGSQWGSHKGSERKENG
jgi:hypothetical protein